MKAKYLSLLAVPFLFAACQEEALVNAPTFDKEGQVPVQITLGTPDAMNATRAYTHTDGNNSATLPESSAKGALNNVDWNKYDLRYILEIYDTDKQEDGDNTIQIGDEKLAKERIYLIAPEGGSVSCAPRLTPNRGYQFVVWADIIEESGLSGEVALSREDDATWKKVADNHYNTNGIYDYTAVIANPSKYVGLKNITINDEWTINDETRDAYFVSQYEVVTTATSLNLTLKRPFGKLRVVTTDIEDLKLGTYPQWTKISYNATRPAAFNAFSKEYSEDVVMAATDVFEAGLIYYANESSDASHAYEIDNENKTLFTDYIFGKEGEQTSVQFTLAAYEGSDANSRLIHEYAFSTDIPVQRNYLTTLQGNVLTTATDIEIKVDPAFAGNIDFTVEDDGMIKDADGNYIIVNKSGLYYLANTVNSGVYNFAGETVKLGCDIDLEGAEWTPINGFKGTFDGQNAPTMRSQEENILCYTISNFKVNVLERGGLFGSVTSATIKNLNVENVNIKSTHYAGAIVAHALCANIENCSVKDIIITLNPNVADANGEHNGDKAGGVVGYLCADGGNASLKDCEAENVTITAYRDFGGIVGHTGGDGYTPIISGNSVGSDVKNIILIIDNSNNYKNYGEKSAHNVGAIIGRNDASTGENVETEEGAVFVVYSTEHFEDTDGNVHVYTAEALTAAIKDNETAAIIMHEGTYAVVVDVKGNKSLNIKAADNEVVVLAGIGHQSNGLPSTVVVEGITIDNSLQPKGWFTGTAQNINPCVGAWGGNFTFNNCTFEVEGTSKKETGVMTWWTTKENYMSLIFNGCTFNGIDNHASARAMQIYGHANMKVVNCVFNTKKDYSIKYVGQEGNKAEFIGNTVNNTTNFVQLGSSPYAGKDYTVEFTNNTLAEGINHFYIDNEENQTIIVDGLTYVSEGLWKNKAGEYIAQTAEALTAATKNATENITICLGNDIVGNAIAHQNENVNVVIDGKNFKYDGTIDIYGYARYEGEETLTFQNINFEHTDGAIDFISCNTTDATKRYAHNVTVNNCTFTGNNSGDVVGMRYRQCYNLTVKNSTATNVHSLLWATGVSNGFTVDNVTVDAKSGGVSFGTTGNMAVKNSTFVVANGYGIRADGGDAYTLNVENNAITAAMPVVVRNLKKGNYKLNLSGTNTLTTDKTYHVILTSGADDLNALAEPTGTYEIMGAEAFVVYPKLEAFIGTKSYTKLDDALKAAVNGDIVKVKGGEYYPKNAGGKKITISAMENETVVFKLRNEGEDGCDYSFGSAGTGVGSYVFNDITFNTTENNGNYKGYAYMGATYNNCNFVGAWSLNNSNDYSFNECTFDFKNGYFWTWGAKSVAFDGCTFNGNSKCILAHGSAATNITVNNCEFAATEKGFTGGGENTACVEIDPVGTNVYTISFTGNNTKTESYSGWTRIKDGSTGHIITGI